MSRNNSIDGFGVRRRPQNSNLSRQRQHIQSREIPERFLIDPARGTGAPQSSGIPLLTRSGGQGAVGGDPLNLPKPLRRGRDKIGIDLSLDDSSSASSSGGGKSPKSKRRFGRRSRKKIIVTILTLLLIALLAFGGYFLYKFLVAGGKIFKGNVITALFDQGRPLQKDENGRSNILLFGTSEDDPGHPGGDLTDSIMVVSIDQEKHDAFLVSIPRDLHVKYGRACTSGYEGKINVVYSCFKESGGEDGGSEALRKKVGEVLGLDIQYSTHVNYTVMREAVDAVGGIIVMIESDDPRGILDRNFDWACNYQCYYVKHPNGPAHLDGVHALALARARGDVAPTYGLSRSNPDRQDNQRKILIALKDKAVSAGVLTNPVAVNGLLDTLGNNLRTNFAAEEIKTLLDLGNTIKTENITSFSLENDIKPLATATCFSGDICPNAGNFNYSDIHAAIQALSTGNAAALEYAKIGIFNASGTAGLAQTEADKLESKGLTISTVGNAPTSLGAKPFQFYDLSGGKKSATLKKLKELFGADPTPGTPAGINVSSLDFAVIVGPQSADNAAQ